MDFDGEVELILNKPLRGVPKMPTIEWIDLQMNRSNQNGKSLGMLDHELVIASF